MTAAARLDITSPRAKPVAVVDIGSNSVRLVVYDGLRRSPSPVFNEKVLCGLGKGVALTGMLAPEGIRRAINELKRFRALCRIIGAETIYAVATAAAREAKNGPAFIKKAQQALGSPIDVLTGKQEAEYAALGVISGIPDADGVVGDLGGGSLELVDVKNGRMGQGITLPLGPLRLVDMAGGSLVRAREIVDAALMASPLVEILRGRNFYAVGGTWRNLARLHMAQSGYPLHVLHSYTIPRESARAVADVVSGLSPGALKDVRPVSKSRADTLPFGALVLERLLALSQAQQLVVSVFGVREGLLYGKLRPKRREADPLLSACWDFARRYARSPEHELELCDWTDQIFGSEALPETAEQRRLRHAACLLADIGWRAHPDYRGERSLSMISQAAFVGVDHPGRLFLSLAVFFRYEGSGSSVAPREFLRLMDEDMLERAHVLASAQRLAYVLTAAMPGLLPKIKLSFTPKALVMKLPKRLADIMGERVEKRLEGLAAMLGRSAKIEIG